MDDLYYFLPFFVNGRSVYVMTFGAYGAYFDESERLEKGEPLCVAGFTFKDNKYRQFCRDWKRLLKTAFPDRILKSIHMKDLIQGKKEYKGLEIPDRVQCLRRAADIIRSHALMVTGALVDQKEFEEVAGPEWPQRFGSSYTALCQRAAQVTATWLKHHKRKRPVVYTFESGHKWEHATDQVFKGIQRTPHLRELYQYGHHTFALKNESYGAQAADVAAWVAVRIHLAGSTRSVAAFLPALEKLVTHFDARNEAMVRFMTGDVLKEFIDEQRQRSSTEEIPCDIGPIKKAFR